MLHNVDGVFGSKLFAYLIAHRVQKVSYFGTFRCVHMNGIRNTFLGLSQVILISRNRRVARVLRIQFEDKLNAAIRVLSKSNRDLRRPS